MDEKFWDALAEVYEQQIFNVLKSDRHQTFLNCLDRLSCRAATAADFGCGVGRFLYVLSARFKEVYAVDISGKCLDVARKRCRRIANVVYLKGDLTDPVLKLPRVDLAISVNVLIMPSREERVAILKNISRHLKRGGHFLLVVPSLESAVYARFRLKERDEKTGESYSGGYNWGLGGRDRGKASVGEGLLNWAGVLTKHYLKEELAFLLSVARLKVLRAEKIEYSWRAIFPAPPHRMRPPYPWDWLILSRKY